MADLKTLFNQLTSFDKLLNETKFIAPCVKGSMIKISVDAVVYHLTPQPPNFTGWGIFQPLDAKKAEVIGKPTTSQINAYLNLFQPFSLKLAYPLEGKTWLAYPINEAENVQPVPVHLVTVVTEGAANQQIIARYDSQNFWFEKLAQFPTNITQNIPQEKLQISEIKQTLISQGISLEQLSVHFGSAQ